MDAKKMATGVVLLLFLFLSIPLEALAQEQSEQSTGMQRTGRWAVGTGIGLQSGTADDDAAFAFGLNADYFLNQHLSLGPLLQFGFTGNLTQVGLSAQAKYTFDLPRTPELKPHLQGGLGFLHVDMDQPPAGPNDSDTGFLVPFGGGFDLELSRNLSLGTIFLLNFTDADIQGERVDNLFMSWFFGLKFML